MLRPQNWNGFGHVFGVNKFLGRYKSMANSGSQPKYFSNLKTVRLPGESEPPYPPVPGPTKLHSEHR